MGYSYGSYLGLTVGLCPNFQGDQLPDRSHRLRNSLFFGFGSTKIQLFKRLRHPCQALIHNAGQDYG